MSVAEPVEVGKAGQGPPVPPPAAPPRLWRNRDFMLLWSGQTVSSLGSSMSGIVFTLLVLEISGSPAAAGIAGALGSLPYIFLSLPVGALIDRWDRKRVMILADTGRALSAATIPIAMLLGVLTIWQLYANALIEGILYVFFNIAEVAAVPRVVPRAQLPSATAQNQAADATAGLLGPGLGGTLYQSVGHAFPFFFDAVSFSLSVVSLLFIKTNFQKDRSPSPRERHLIAEIKEGVAWLWHQPVVRFMSFLTGGLNFTNGASGLVLIVLAKSMGASESNIGAMFSIGAIGGILGSVVGGALAKRFTFGQAILGTVWFGTLLWPLYAFAPNIWVLGAILSLGFLTQPIYNVVQYSYRLALIPDELQGRVNSSFRLVAFGFQPLGVSLAGVLLQVFGPVPAIAVFSAWRIMISLLATLNRDVRNAPPLEEAQNA